MWVMNVKEPGSRLMRQLAEYDYEHVNKRGSQNANADALSRTGSAGRVQERTDIPGDNTKKTDFV